VALRMIRVEGLLIGFRRHLHRQNLTQTAQDRSQNPGLEGLLSFIAPYSDDFAPAARDLLTLSVK